MWLFSSFTRNPNRTASTLQSAHTPQVQWVSCAEMEFTIQGMFVKQISMDPAQGGSFGLAVETSGNTAQFAAVDDATNLFLIWTLPLN